MLLGRDFYFPALWCCYLSSLLQDLVAVYCSLIRSILEYASIVFANLPQYLSNALENIQKSALGIIVPSMSYSQALHLTGLPSLQERRESACIKFISKISPSNPLYSLISSRSQAKDPHTILEGIPTL